MPDAEAVTRESALAAIEHVASYNGGSREAEAIAMLAAAPQQEAQEPVEWRELAAKVMDALADAQEQTNAAYPAHVSCYPGWETQARWLRWHADMFRTGNPVGNGAGQPAVLAALAAAPTTQPAPQQEAFAWHVCSVNSDGSLSLEHTAAWEEAAHEHINDAITEHDIEGAGSWVVRPAYHAPQPSPAAQGDALPREELAWLVVQEACETEPADEDDPECIRILRRDLKSSVLAAFLRHDAARAAQEGGA